jgi:site-specific DNA recombinase
VPDVHPNIAEHYRAKVIRLAETLAEPESNGEAREDIRSLIGEVVITPGEKRGESHATLRGALMAILDLAAGRRRSPKAEVIINVLACPRNQVLSPCTPRRPVELRGGWGEAPVAEYPKKLAKKVPSA